MEVMIVKFKMITFLKLSRCCSLKSLTLGLIPLMDNMNDTVTETNTSKKIRDEQAENETGWDRLYMMFSTDETGTISRELNSVYTSTFCGTFTGVVYGGFVHSRLAYLDFIERNKATSFSSHLEAKKMLQDRVTVNFAKGAFRWGWRMGLFTMSYVFITTTISVYRGKSSLLEYVLAGGLTGAAYKVNMGLRGMAVGGGLGTALGTLAGGVTLALLKVTGTTMEDMRYWQYQWKSSRDAAWEKALSKNQEEVPDVDPLLREREEILKALKANSVNNANSKETQTN